MKITGLDRVFRLICSCMVMLRIRFLPLRLNILESQIKVGGMARFLMQIWGKLRWFQRQ